MRSVSLRCKTKLHAEEMGTLCLDGLTQHYWKSKQTEGKVYCHFVFTVLTFKAERDGRLFTLICVTKTFPLAIP